MCRFSYFVGLCSITTMVCVICVKYVLLGISVVIPLVNDIGLQNMDEYRLGITLN
jgi:hypothetical protein